MNVAYVFSTPSASFILEKMIVPQLEEGRHGANAVGMFFFVDNKYLLVRGNPTGERLAQIAKKTGMLLMGCDQCCYSAASPTGSSKGSRSAASPTFTARCLERRSTRSSRSEPARGRTRCHREPEPCVRSSPL